MKSSGWLRVIAAWTFVALVAGTSLPGCGDDEGGAKRKTPDPIPTSGPEWNIDVRRPIELTPQARIPELDPSFDHVSVTADSVTIHYKAKPTIDIGVSNVIAGEGYLREVTGVVSRTTSKLELATKPAFLVDLILDGSFRITQTPAPSSFEAGTGKTSFPLEAAVSLISTPPLSGFKCSGGVAPFNFDPSVDVDLDPTLDFDIEPTSWIPPRGKLVSGELSIKGGIEIGGVVTQEQAGQTLTCSLDIVKMLGVDPIKLPAIRFLIPPGIPVWVEQEFYPIMEASLSAQETLTGASSKFGVGFTAHVGTKYDQTNGWTGIFDVQRSASASTSLPPSNQYPALKVSAGLKAGLGWAGYLYGAIGPKVGMTGGITGSYAVDPNSCGWSTAVEVGANLEVGAEVKVPAIDLTLVEVGFTQPLTKATIYQNQGTFPECCDGGVCCEPGSDAAACMDAGDADAGDAGDAADAADADASLDAADASDASLDAVPDVSDGGCVHPPVVKNCANGWCTIPAGCYTRGSPLNEPCRHLTLEDQHQVTLTRSFRMQEREVTEGEFVAALGWNPQSTTFTCGTNCPLYKADWSYAAAYANALSIAASLTPCYSCTGSTSSVACAPAPAYDQGKIYDCPGFRLPTDAEWEYAYRAGTTTAFYSGANSAALCGECDEVNPAQQETALHGIGWYCSNSGNEPHLAKLLAPNGWGLYDMAGNAWEHVNDVLYNDFVALGPSVDPWGQPPGTLGSAKQVCRGGSYGGSPEFHRAAHREFNCSAGFRLAQTLP